MKIKNRLYISAGISIILVVILFSLVLVTSGRIAEGNKKHELLDNVRVGIAELDIITYDYLLHREKRMVQQWNSKYNSLGGILEKTEEEVMKSIGADYAALGDLFSQITTNYKARQRSIQEGASQERIDTAIGLEERLVAQLLIKSHSVITDATRFVEEVQVEVMEAQRLAVNLILILMITLAFTVTTSSLLVARSISKPLSKLADYSRKVGEGEYTADIEIKGKDEVASVASDVKSMVGQLLATSEELKKELTERKQAEERIEHLNLFLRAIRRVNQLIVREKDREKLLKGACENLIETRGYYNTWIALLDEEGKLKTYAEAGLGKDFLPMIELLKGGKLTTCSQKALKQQEVVIIEDPVSSCTECPLAQKYSGRAGLAIRLEHSGRVYGLMTVSISAHLAIDQEEQSLFKEVAEDIALGLHNIELGENLEKRTYDLKERVKELNCLWEISNLIERPDISLEAMIKGIVYLLPSAWQYPQITCARIILKAKEYKTKNFKETAWKQASDIIAYKKPSGTVEVYYLEERPQRDEGPFLKEERNLINIIAERLGNLIEEKQSEMKLQQSYQKLQKTMEDTIYTIGKIAETRDPYTAGHQKNVAQIATFIAQEMKLPEDRIEGIRIASLVHDIGKISIPSEILNKPTKLSEIEFSLIKEHSQVGYDVLKSIEFPWPVARIVLQHHERLDGSGYPNNLIGDKIILEARILGVVDVVEAMSSHRPYRPALGIDAALEEISKNKGTLYDPEVVDMCIKLFKEKEFKF